MRETGVILVTRDNQGIIGIYRFIIQPDSDTDTGIDDRLIQYYYTHLRGSLLYRNEMTNFKAT